MLSSVRYCFTIFLAVCITACHSTHVMSSGDRLKDNTHTILILLRDDRSIKFYPERYTVNSAADSDYINGVGTQYNGREEIFNGSINYHDIKEIQVIESTVFSGSIVPIAVIGIVVTVFILFLVGGGYWGRVRL